MATWENIHGYFNFGNLYSAMVDYYPDDSHFVEVGAWLGRSAAFMATEIQKSGRRIKFDVIDIWKTGEWSDEPHFQIEQEVGGDLYKAFINNIEKCGLLDYVNPIRNFSLEEVKNYKDRSLEFVFVDACHSEPEVIKDIEAWLPKVKKGGILAGDDYNWEGVRKGVLASLPSNDLQISGNTWIYRKK